MVGNPLKEENINAFKSRRVNSGGGVGGGGGGGNGGGGDRFNLDWCALVDVCCESYFEHGPDCSEKSYVDKVFYKLYELSVPCIRERPLFSTVDGISISRGRVDLEIDSKFLLEFKITQPSPNNILRDRRQLLRYLKTYDEMGKAMERGALVYFHSGEVRVIHVSLA